MHSVNEVKLRAAKLRTLLSEYPNPLNHSHSLELVSKWMGYRNWNTYSAHLSANDELLPIPKGWQVTGETVANTQVGISQHLSYQDSKAAVIRSKPDAPDHSGGITTLMQVVDAESFIGANLRLSAMLKAEQCDDLVTLWMRVDGPDGPNRVLSFDNMTERERDGPLTGTTDWLEREIVLEVPDNAVSVSYGFFLRGSGAGYAAQFKVVKVGEDVPVTSFGSGRLLQPTNLNFSEVEGSS